MFQTWGPNDSPTSGATRTCSASCATNGSDQRHLIAACRPEPAVEFMRDPYLVEEPLNRVIDAVLDGVPSDRRALLAIDGIDGSGKSTFAAAVAARVLDRQVVLIHVDDFLNHSAIRHRRGRDSPLGFFLDTYDYESLMKFALEPLRRSGDALYRSAHFDGIRDSPRHVPPAEVASDALVIVEGMFLHRDELTDLWDRSAFLDVPFIETARRMAKRDGTNADPDHPSMRRYVEGQRLYFRSSQPWTRADIVIDNTTPMRPQLIDASRVSEVHAL